MYMQGVILLTEKYGISKGGSYNEAPLEQQTRPVRVFFAVFHCRAGEKFECSLKKETPQ